MRHTLSALIALFVGFSLNAQQPGKHAVSSGRPAAPSAGSPIVPIATAEEYKEALAQIPELGGNAAIIMFTAVNCNPCQQYKPTVKAAAEKAGVPVFMAEIPSFRDPLHPLRAKLQKAGVPMNNRYPLLFITVKKENGWELQPYFEAGSDVSAKLAAVGAKGVSKMPVVKKAGKPVLPTALPGLGLGVLGKPDADNAKAGEPVCTGDHCEIPAATIGQ